ncbi:Gfo/Idh/MocA family protein [Leeuwenhoekiella sp. MAR_2009_132]|uniref:Gfo/Idh/MocA family protein n=1 Tax=Leeuwenhoekiella sp. MAR_2009_132 TaxID=1392489 RepID=UPI00048E911B|nr:Gfo/Idh/MocA family oxidoreductase [Leeuwenhoekiella sp. MAR_2009_132]
MQNRRSFIKKSGLAVAATTIPFPYLACSKPNKKLGIALLGLGSYATNNLAPALQKTQHIELRGIVTGSPEKIPTWKDRYGIKDSNIYNYENLSSIVDNKDIDVVYIVTPTFLHKKFCILAAEAGKHVFCEKPMAMTVAECQEIIDACDKNGVKLAIGYRMQHEENTKTIIEWSKTQPYGALEQVHTEAGFKIGADAGWRLDGAKGGGAIYDMGVYPINAMRYATGLEPVSLTAKHVTQRKSLFTNGAEEITYFDVEFPDGITAKGRVTYADNINFLKVACKDGNYELSPFQSYTGVQGSTSDGKKLEPCNCNQQTLQMDDDALSILENKEMTAPGIEGLRDIQIVEAALESGRTNGAKILLKQY